MNSSDSVTAGHRIRAAANALNLSTATGLLLAGLSRTPVEKGPQGLLLGTHYKPKLPLAGAFTVGNVVFYRADRAFIDSRPELLGHEARHASQYAWCLGLPFFPLYAACAAYSLWRTGDPGSRNFFERNAGLQQGGYHELPTVARLPAVGNCLRRSVPQRPSRKWPARKWLVHQLPPRQRPAARQPVPANPAQPAAPKERNKP